MWDLRGEIDRIRARGLYRHAVTFEGKGVRLRKNGREHLVFGSNDYLGLSADPKVVEAYAVGARRHDAGSGAAHLVTGHRQEHAALEEVLADFLQRDRALLFSTGYMANLGVVCTFLGGGDAIYQDRLNHASLLDAGRLSGARCICYAHGDSSNLARRIGTGEYRNRLVVTDGVFSMDGDFAPLNVIHAVARTALRIVRGEPWRRERLQALINRFRQGAAALGLPVIPSETPILPLIAGETDRALGLSRKLLKHDIVVSAIRPPTLPTGTARLRITLSMAHCEDDIDRLLAALSTAWPCVRPRC